MSVFSHKFSEFVLTKDKIIRITSLLLIRFCYFTSSGNGVRIGNNGESKHLSKSDIPCCRCCGEKSHIEFLSLDHIAGRKEMDSEPELVKLGYSSSFKANSLSFWVSLQGDKQ